MALPAHAQASIVNNDAAYERVAQRGLAASLNALQAKITSATVRLMTLKDCHERGMLFGPVDDGKEGCVSVTPDCILPWVAVLQMTQTATAYLSNTAPYGTTCTSQVRKCDPSTGKLSGTYTQQSCSVMPGVSCTTPWGVAVGTSKTIVGYKTATVAYNQTCESETRTCTNGTLSGSAAFGSCTPDTPVDCALPWSGNIAHGQSIAAYAYSNLPYGQNCASYVQTRTCTNGTLSGSYSSAGCSVTQPANCNIPWGGQMASGQGITTYGTSSVAHGQSCPGETRWCSNGTLSGSYSYSGCTVQPINAAQYNCS